MVKLLLDHHADVNADWGRPLRFAVKHGYRIVAETLLAHGADPNPGGGEPDGALLAAIHANDAPMAELFLHAGANPNKEYKDWVHAPFEHTLPVTSAQPK